VLASKKARSSSFKAVTSPTVTFVHGSANVLYAWSLPSEQLLEPHGEQQQSHRGPGGACTGSSAAVTVFINNPREHQLVPRFHRLGPLHSGRHYSCPRQCCDGIG